MKWFADNKCRKQKCNVASITLAHFITELSSIRLYGASDRQKISVARLETDLRKFDWRHLQIVRPKSCGSWECNNAERSGDTKLSFDELAVQLESQVQIPCFNSVNEGKAWLNDDCEHE